MKIPEFTLLAVRLVLAVVFLLAGATKFADPRGTRQALRDFGLPSLLARPMVLLLPAVEIAVALALIPSQLAWYGAWGALGLLGVFMLAVGVAMLRGRKPDCHCFGQLHSSPVGSKTLVRNAALAACAGWLASRGPLRSGPELWTWIATLNETEQKFAFVAACAVAFMFFRAIVSARPVTESIESQLSFGWGDEGDGEDKEEAAPAQRPAPRPVRRSARAPMQRRPSPPVSHARGIGLAIGTPAPEFELPGPTGEKQSLQSLRGQGKDVMLVFASPLCKPCQALFPNLVRWMREMEGLPKIVLISRGAPQDHLAKLNEFGADRVLLQRHFEVAEAYDCDSTPAAVLVGADGMIRSGLAVGGPAIRQLMSSSAVGNVSAPR